MKETELFGLFHFVNQYVATSARDGLITLHETSNLFAPNHVIS